MSNMKEVQSEMFNDPNIIDVEVIEVTNPVINIKRSITVVFSKDSVPSTCTAALLMGILERESCAVVSETYKVEFVEIGSFNGKKISDAYLWLGLEKVTPDLHPTMLEKFNSAQHSLYNGEMDLSYPDLSTPFQDAVATIREEVKYIRPAYDFAYSSMIQFSNLIPEMDFQDIYRVVKDITLTDRYISNFLSTVSKSDELLSGWAHMNSCLAFLGLPHTVVPASLRAEDMIEAYLNHRAQFKEIINASPFEEITFGGRVNRVMKTSIPDGFWMARRILSLAGVLHHNVRLVEEGFHTETNLPKSVANTFRIGTARSTASQ